MNPRNSTVCAVVVTYRPESENLRRLFDSLLPQVETLVVVDNGSLDPELEWIRSYASGRPIVLIPIGSNKGIAAAQNIGIEWVREHGADYVILFDHDSEPAAGMVGKLLDVAEVQRQAGVKVASVGPRYRDDRQDNPPPFIRIEGFRLKRQKCNDPQGSVEVDYLIASGCLIPMETISVVGGMTEDLFIDYVDIEWGLRAKAKGFQSFGACGAHMNHSLGDTPISFFGSSFPARSPLRHYYMFRNAAWMYRQSWLPLQWKVADGWRLFLKYGFYSFFAIPRHKHWWMMTKGLFHGLFGRMGRLN